MHPSFDAQVSHNARVAPAYDFKLALTRVIEPTGGPGAELATSEDARFVGLMRPWRQARPHWDYAAVRALQGNERPEGYLMAAEPIFLVTDP